jgi:hypothetical protein
LNLKNEEVTTMLELLSICAVLIGMVAIGGALMWPIATLHEELRWYKRIYGEPEFEYDGCEEDDD